MTEQSELHQDSEQQPDSPVDRQRVRLTYEKGEAVKFISHHDEFRLWERVLRRADLPILYKRGFNPQPHMQIAAPLGVGITGVCEFLDITFSPPVPLAELTERIRTKLPPGVFLHDVVEVPLKTASLQSVLIGADYTILIFAEPGEIDPTLIEERIATFLNKTEVWRERERKGQKYIYNLRPLALELRYDGYDTTAEEHRIFLRVQQRPGATGRPDEVVDAMGFDDFARTLRRDRLYFSDSEADVTVFAGYPVIEQASITKDEGHSPRRRKRRGRDRPKAPAGTPEGRSISERAGDEFA